MARNTRKHPTSWGTVQQLPSGAWRAFYRKDGARFTAPFTFPTKDAAHTWLAAERADRSRGTWRDPRQGQQTLTDYANAWLDSRPDLSPRTLDVYRQSLNRWILPRVGGARGIELGPLPLADITFTVVRTWHAAVFTTAREQAARRHARTSERTAHPARTWAGTQGIEVPSTGRLSPGVLSAWRDVGSPMPDLEQHRPRVPVEAAGRTTTAAAYRFLRTILNTAVRERLILSNPCQIPNAGIVKHRERTTANPLEVQQLAQLMPPEYAAAVTLAAWSGLRYGELFALARRNVNLEAGTLQVDRALVCVPGQRITFGKTKTAKSNRAVHLPAFVLEVLTAHLERYGPTSPDALLFAMPDGSPVTGLRLSFLFRRARQVIGREDLTWHDLRHTGATLAYKAGASVPEVQARLGHTTMRAAMIYAHAADDSDQLIAQRLDAMFSPTSTAPRLRAV